MQVWKSQQCSHSRNECEAKNQGKQDFKGQEKADTVQQVRWREEGSCACVHVHSRGEEESGEQTQKKGQAKRRLPL